MNDNIEEVEKQIEEISLEDKIKDLQLQLVNQNNKYLYLYAEFENYKKRVSKEKSDLVAYTKENIYSEILTLIEDVERSITNTKNSNDINIVKDGNSVIHNRFLNYINKNNIKEIDALNKDFDAHLHEAITTIEVSDELKNKVVDVIQKGYTMNDKVIRYSKVIVGK
jgi:molecular chaperone GrpE